MLLISIAVASIFSSCKKSKEIIEKQEEDQVKSAAKHNNEVLTGTGNFFVSKSFSPNQVSQLIAKLAYNGDSVFYFGSTNAEAKVSRLHTIMVSKGTGKYLVTEYGDDNASTISYHIINGKKDNLVVRTTLFSLTEKEVALLNYDWTNNTSEIITAVTYQNNQPIKSATIKKTSSTKNAPVKFSSGNTWTKDCGTPAPQGAGEQDEYLYNSMQHIACNGTHPINEPWLILEDKLNNAPNTNGIKEKFSDLKNSQGSYSSVFEKLKSAINKLMPTMSTLEQMEWVKKILKKFEDDNHEKALLMLSHANSDLSYDDGVDHTLIVTLSLTDPNTNIPYTKSGQLTTIKLKNGNTVVYEEMEYTSKVDGNATFLIDIEGMSNLGNAQELIGEYGFKNQTDRRTFKITLNWIVPNISIYSGEDQFGEYGKPLKDPLIVKIVDNNGKPVNKWPVKWSVKSGNGFVTSDTETNASGLAQAKWTFGNDIEEQIIEVTAKDRLGNDANGSPKVFHAKVLDSMELYTKAVVGKWTVYGYDPNNPTTTYNLELFGNGSGRYSIPDQTTGEIRHYSISWYVTKRPGGGYALYERGFWHFAYDTLTRDRLTYPVSSFKTYANFDSKFVSQKFVKN